MCEPSEQIASVSNTIFGIVNAAVDQVICDFYGVKPHELDFRGKCTCGNIRKTNHLPFLIGICSMCHSVCIPGAISAAFRGSDYVFFFIFTVLDNHIFTRLMKVPPRQTVRFNLAYFDNYYKPIPLLAKEDFAVLPLNPSDYREAFRKNNFDKINHTTNRMIKKQRRYS